MKLTNKTIFRLIFIIFLVVVIWFLYDMSRQTSAPWNKAKQAERAIEE